MRPSHLTLPIAALALGAFEARAEPVCYADWSVAAPIVKKEGLVTVEKLTDLARSKLGSEIVKTTLCADGVRYTYRLVVRDANNQLKTLIVDAHKPFDR